MNCKEATPLAQAYADGELDLMRSVDLENHLNSCRTCSQAYGRVQSLKKVLASADLYQRAPAGLRRSIRSRIGLEEPKQSWTWSSWWNILKPVIPALGVAAVALLMFSALNGPSPVDRLADDVVANHVRSLMVDHRTDVPSSDQHTVKPWFQGKLDFSPPVNDFAAEGFDLVGGRLDYLQDRPVAALVYGHRQHVINLFIWREAAKPEAERKAITRNGFHLIHWAGQGMSFWAVSDLNQGELMEFSKLIN